MPLLRSNPIRLLTAVPLCDGHDSAVTTVNQELIKQGFEVVYMGYHRSAEDMVRAAIQEDVNALGISSYNGGHIEFFREVVNLLKQAGRDDIGVFGGGGGTITPEDVVAMKEDGVDEIFIAGTTFDFICERLVELYGHKQVELNDVSTDSGLGQMLTAVELESEGRPAISKRGRAKVIGFTGPGGAGKTTLIDEWIRGALEDDPKVRIGVLSHDPSLMSLGGLLGDRATMIYAQNDRVFLRSMATRGQQGGLSPFTHECLEWMVSEQANFDYVIVETVGTGQEALPFSDELIDTRVLVLHPEYGARIQLQKILMIEVADAIVVNKSDWAGSKRALEEVTRQVGMRSAGSAPVFLTMASQHRDEGIEILRKKLSV